MSTTATTKTALNTFLLLLHEVNNKNIPGQKNILKFEKINSITEAVAPKIKSLGQFHTNCLKMYNQRLICLSDTTIITLKT